MDEKFCPIRILIFGILKVKSTIEKYTYIFTLRCEFFPRFVNEPRPPPTPQNGLVPTMTLSNSDVGPRASRVRSRPDRVAPTHPHPPPRYPPPVYLPLWHTYLPTQTIWHSLWLYSKYVVY
jgi:hypothetical protein